MTLYSARFSGLKNEGWMVFGGWETGVHVTEEPCFLRLVLAQVASEWRKKNIRFSGTAAVIRYMLEQ